MRVSGLESFPDEAPRETGNRPFIGPSPDIANSAGHSLDELLEIQDHERQRLSQELHDSAGHLIVSLQLSVARLRQLSCQNPDEGLLDEIGEITRQIDQEIRCLAFLRYPVELGDRDLSSASRTLAAGFGRRTGLDMTFKSEGSFSDVDPRSSKALLRVLQEALLNVHRHAHADSVRVGLKASNDEVRLTVCDNGVGMPVASLKSDRGVGLQSICSRVEALGGTLRIGQPAHGMKLTATVPLHA